MLDFVIYNSLINYFRFSNVFVSLAPYYYVPWASWMSSLTLSPSLSPSLFAIFLLVFSLEKSPRSSFYYCLYHQSSSQYDIFIIEFICNDKKDLPNITKCWWKLNFFFQQKHEKIIFPEKLIPEQKLMFNNIKKFSWNTF